MRIAVIGASGFIGRRVAELARRRGHEVLAMGRGRGDRSWDPMSGPAPLDGVEAVVHLAGEGILGRWTRSKLAAIRDSRVVGTRNLAEGMRRAGVRVLACSSAVGYYGDRGDEELTEDSAPGEGFLADVCKQWEAEAAGSGARTVAVRTGVVLGPGGGALRLMLPAFKLGLGGRLGSGRQWMSWIHLDDLAALYLRAVEDAALSGRLLGTAPEPVRNADFASTLARVLGRWAVLPAPAWQLRLALGSGADALLASQRCRPARTLAAGFEFVHPGLEPALRRILAL